MSYNRVLMMDDNKRIQEIFNYWKKLYRLTNDSWPALFNTEKHQRRVAHRKLVESHLRIMICRAIGVETWRVVDLAGSKKETAIVWEEK